jgi:diguanylate cyclase (GGDEF)-like protein/PAS domain S-box-containing protein
VVNIPQRHSTIQLTGKPVNLVEGGVLALSIQWIVFAVILILNAVIASSVAFLLRRRYRAPGRDAMLWMLGGLTIWTFAYAMITLSTSMEAKLFWLKIENIGILTVPAFWFIFTLQYTRMDRWLNRYTGALFFIIPFTGLALLFISPWFQYFYSSVHPVTETGGPLVIARGPFYFAPLIQAYIFNLLGMTLLIWRFIQYRSIYRRQLLILIGAVLIPLLVNVFYQLAPRVIPSFTFSVDLTPISFTLTAFLLSTGVLGLRLFDLIPIARHTVLEHIPEMVFVVDAHDRVLDANSVAQKMLGKPMDEIVGNDPLEVFREWPELLNRFLTANEAHEEIQIPGDPPRMLELVVSALYNQLDQLEGRIIVAHDITEHKWLEHDLTYANEALTRQLQEIEKLRAELQEQAIHDPLTNVYNRRYMAEFLDKEIARAERDQAPISVVILDMDYFKQFNDTYGHKCGDVILQFFANFLTDHTRRGDVVCRYGGEEFVIVMPNAPFEIGYERAEMWRQTFSETAIEYDGMKLYATFSAGVSCFSQHGSTGDSLLQAADKALYYSKNHGRNRVTRYEKETIF